MAKNVDHAKLYHTAMNFIAKHRLNASTQTADVDRSRLSQTLAQYAG
jgi:hypothetical protein